MSTHLRTVTRMLMGIYPSLMCTLSTEDSTYGSPMQTGVYFLMYIGLCFLDKTHVTPILMGIIV